jgi:hypothetical protein
MLHLLDTAPAQTNQEQSRVSSDKKPKIFPHSLTIELTEKSFAVVLAEAKLRSFKPPTLVLAALLDYLGRKGQSRLSKSIPFSVPFHWRIRALTVSAAQDRGVSVTQFLMWAAIRAANQDVTADDIQSEIRAAICAAGAKPCVARNTRRRAARKFQRSAKDLLADRALSCAAEDFYNIIREVHTYLAGRGVRGDENGYIAFNDIVGPYGFRSRFYGRRTRALMWISQSARRAFVLAIKRFPQEATQSSDVYGAREAFKLAIKLARLNDRMAARRYGWNVLLIKREEHAND